MGLVFPTIGGRVRWLMLIRLISFSHDESSTAKVSFGTRDLSPSEYENKTYMSCCVSCFLLARGEISHLNVGKYPLNILYRKLKWHSSRL